MADLIEEDVPEISGLLHKRRGGFGKMMLNPWNYRFFTLSKDGVLVYFDTDMPEINIYENKPRGKLDLRLINFELHKNAPVEGAPTPYTIQICPATEEKWKLCADTKEDMTRWCNVIERYVNDKSGSGFGVGSGSGSLHGQNSAKPNYTSDDEELPGNRRQQSTANSTQTLANTANAANATSSSNSNNNSGSPGVSPASISPPSSQTSNSSGGRAVSPSPSAISRKTRTMSFSSNMPILSSLASAVSSAGGQQKPVPTVTTAKPAQTTARPPVTLPAPTTTSTTNNKKRSLKVGAKSSYFTAESWETALVLVVANISLYKASTTPYPLLKLVYWLAVNFAVATMLTVRGERLQRAKDEATAAQAAAQVSALQAANAEATVAALTARYGSGSANAVDDVPAPVVSLSSSLSSSLFPSLFNTDTPANQTTSSTVDSPILPPSSSSSAAASSGAITVVAGPQGTRGLSGRPIAGSTLFQSPLTAFKSPDHSWCVCDHRMFNVRIGPDYKRHGKKAPSAAPLYEAIGVDIFCAKTRADHAAPRFELPDTSHINTNHPAVPPIFIVQIQIPSDPPPVFTSVEDGPGWAILIYFRITEETCNQLKDLKSASAAVKLFAQYCEKALSDPLWRGRFKVICSCLNLDDLGFPSAITSYNAKPVLIRRTGSLVRGPNYIEMDIHVHKFNNMAKQCIHTCSSRCGTMYMQIGFVIEGREDLELPETLFGCVGVNKPQEDQADFIFDD